MAGSSRLPDASDHSSSLTMILMVDGRREQSDLGGMLREVSEGGEEKSEERGDEMARQRQGKARQANA